MKTIEVCERTDDFAELPRFHAQVKDFPAYWGVGNSINEAVGDLLRTHWAMFGIKIENLGRTLRQDEHAAPTGTVTLPTDRAQAEKDGAKKLFGN